jgi:hypothetical protein
MLIHEQPSSGSKRGVSIMENTIYNLTDLHTGKILGTYTYAQRNRARNRAGRLDLQYGSHRYAACPVFDRAA